MSAGGALLLFVAVFGLLVVVIIEVALAVFG